MWRRTAVKIVIAWAVINSLMFACLGLLGYKWLKLHQLHNLKRELPLFSNLLTGLKFTSFLAVRLYPVGKFYDLANITSALGQEGLRAEAVISPLIKRALAGKEIEEAELAQVVEVTQALTYKLSRTCRQLSVVDYWPTAKRYQSDCQRVLDTIETLRGQDRKWLTVLGYLKPQHYVVLMQNNMELRPTGGFLGSYAEFWVADGAIKDLTIQDIYVPDGQIKGYVREPEPITKYLFSGGTPGWRLRDSNWEPDFPLAAQQIAWFFEEGGLKPIDGVIGINLFLIQDILKVTGTIDLPDYKLVVTADNFYQHAQYAAENNFFPGSTQKKDFLAATGKSLLTKLLNIPPRELTALAPIMWKNLEQKQIVISLLTFPEFDFFNKSGWDGSIKPMEKDKQGLNDYLFINEANVGINKTNCCIERRMAHRVNLVSPNQLKHEVSLIYKNNNPATPAPPKAWGGGYKDYIRVYLPAAAKLEGVFINEVEVTEIDRAVLGDKLVLGFLVLTDGGKSDLVKLAYTLPLPDKEKPKQYRLTVQKQSGIDAFPYTLNLSLGGNSYQTEGAITQDSIFTFPMVY